MVHKSVKGFAFVFDTPALLTTWLGEQKYLYVIS